MENRNAIKNRMKTIEETKQMASVMELSASAAIHRAQKEVKECEPVFLASEEQKKYYGFAPFTRQGDGDEWVVVAGGDRGLAGGYYVRLFEQVKKEQKIYALGKKTAEFASSRGYHLANPGITRLRECDSAANFLLEQFLKGTISKLFLVTPTMAGETNWKQLLPLEPAKDCGIYDPSPALAAERFVAFYLEAQLQYAIKQAAMCEFAARREAMGAAANNAEEMLEQLTLSYHAARQAAITRELVEIVAGAEEL
ncbi:MAG: F0F1 ATP synthase subunit gamma [Ruminococcaceae bacterium]|nr:F0F1 ATP synthase subunit gamma [Oscillospiraceae bacterium]